MLNSLGFDSLALHVNNFNSDINEAIIFFRTLGIKNFLMIFDYDPLNDSIPILKSKIIEFKKIHTRNMRINLKCAINLHLSQGIGFNNQVSRLYCNKKSKALLITLPLFTDTNYDPISLDINNLLYKKSSFLIFSSFEKIIESSSLDFCLKFINNPRIAVAVDLNYILNPQKSAFFHKILSSGSLIIPSISKDIAYYAGALPSTLFAIDKYGKKDYFRLCTQINKASNKIFNQ